MRCFNLYQYVQFLEQMGLTISIPVSSCLKQKEYSDSLPCSSKWLNLLHKMLLSRTSCQLKISNRISWIPGKGMSILCAGCKARKLLLNQWTCSNKMATEMWISQNIRPLLFTQPVALLKSYWSMVRVQPLCCQKGGTIKWFRQLYLKCFITQGFTLLWRNFFFHNARQTSSSPRTSSDELPISGPNNGNGLLPWLGFHFTL